MCKLNTFVLAQAKIKTDLLSCAFFIDYLCNVFKVPTRISKKNCSLTREKNHLCSQNRRYAQLISGK